MKVTVKLFGEFRAALGVESLPLDLPRAMTCREALVRLAEDHPQLGDLLFAGGKIRDHLHVFVNGRNVVHGQGLGTPLSPGDTLTFFPPISGG